MTGAATVIYEWYEDMYGAYPTPSMVKAFLINQAVDIPDEDNNGVADNAYPVPNEYEGWGRAYLASIVEPGASFLAYDAVTELTTGIYDEYTFTYVNTGEAT